MASTNSPATLWLNSDHARSAAVLGASRSSTGSSSIAGDESVGHRGVSRATTSVSVARSATTSTAGGSEVSDAAMKRRSEEHTSELQSLAYLVCRLLLEKKKTKSI